MKKLVVASVAVATLMLATANDALASCFRQGGCGGCASSSNDCCNYGPVGSNGCGCVSYQQVWKEKEVDVTVYNRVARQVNFEYNVCKPVVTAEKRKVMTCQLVYKDVPFTYTECIPVMTPQKQMITRMTTVTKEVDFTYNECVPTTTVQKRKVVRYTAVPTTVEREVTCYSTVMVPCCDPCGRVGYTCQRVCTTQKVQCTVMQQVATESEVDVPVTTYTMVPRQGKRTVCECVPVQQEITVNVCTYNRVEKSGMRKVCDRVMVEQEVTVNVCNYVTEKMVGTRTVYDCVPTTQKVMVKYCEMVQVAAAAPMAPVAVATSYSGGCGCQQNCNSGCFSGCNFGGCFSGCRMGGCFSGCFGGCR